MRQAFRFLLLITALLIPSLTWGQATPTTTDTSWTMDVIAREFGGGYTLVPKQPILTGDFDADGAEDVVFVVTGKNPLTDEAGHNYRVIDPYNSYFGYGNPKVTHGFISMNAGDPRYLLVVHGWKGGKPKAKFVIINLPFEKISTGSFMLKKKAVAAITAEESGGVASAVYWDGKRYKWEAYGSH